MVDLFPITSQQPVTEDMDKWSDDAVGKHRAGEDEGEEVEGGGLVGWRGMKK